ncbi:MAG: sulfate adenylyltransferase, partial [Myxococcota bacterium]
ARLERDAPLVLRDPEGFPLAVLRVEDVWELDPERTAASVYGTTDRSHPGVEHLHARKNRFAVGGRVDGLRAPLHYDSPGLRLSPAECREEFERRGWRSVVAFQTRNPLHRAHFELTRQAMAGLDAGLLLHPVVGMTKAGDVDHFTRVRCYRALMPHYPEGRALLALLPLAMRMAGPREALWHAIIRKNFGCTHFIVGRDHAGPGASASGEPFYGPYDAQELAQRHESELGIAIVPFRNMVYSETRRAYLPDDEAGPEESILSISGSEQRRRLERGEELPDWFTLPEVERVLRQAYPPLAERGLAIFLTGLSGAGKSTLARALLDMLLEQGGRPVTLLDGDLVRKNLSSELGFSREHRDLNVRRIGFVASEITKNGGIAVCAPIAPYDRT